MSKEVLPNGADVEIDGVDGTRPYDRVEIYDNGMVFCVNKKAYQLDIWPMDRIESIHAHTKHLQDRDWW